MNKRKTVFEPFKIKMVEPIPMLNRQERIQVLEKAKYNLFKVPAKYVTFDFLTDSGTTAMSAAQWGAMMTADESYAGSTSFEKFEAAVQALTGYEAVIPTHQGRAAERVLFSVVSRKDFTVPTNNHFDTTRANIEQNGGKGVDLVIAEGSNPLLIHPFKGNVDIARLDRFCSENQANIPVGMLTITNNTGGGQPVSMENIRQASEVYHRYGIPFVMDVCRFAENAWFIKERESGYQNKSIREIVREMFSYADGCTMSAKKDALVNIGGFIAIKPSSKLKLWDKSFVQKLRDNLILTEGFPTYGGLAARDLDAMTQGLEEVLDENYLRYRIAVSRYLGEGLTALGIPIVQPTGGHAVFIDAKTFLPHIPPAQYPGHALACELYLSEGIRSCEIGSVMFGAHATMELVRLAIPRRVYTQSHFDWILEGMAELVQRKSEIRGYKITYEPPFLRHFTAEFEQK